MKTIIFDLMGVIFPEGHVIKKIFHPLLGGDYANIKAAYNEYARGKIGNAEFLQRTGIDKTQEARFLDAIRIDAEAVTVLPELKRRGFGLVAFSHFPKEWGEWLLHKFGLDKLFDAVLLSGEHGFTKSEQGTYEWLLEKIGRPNECWFVDDKLGNLASANAAGIRTIWFERELADKDYEPDYVTYKLSELLEIFTA